VEDQGQDCNTRILIDTTVDARDQLTDAKVQNLDAVFFSHCHSDHINGMDDLRVFSYVSGYPIDTYSNQYTIDDLEKRFPYAAYGGYGGVYKPFLKPHVLKTYDQFQVGSFDVGCFPQKHANVDSIGFRFGKFAYCVDVADLEEESLQKLEGIETWVVDAAGYNNEKIITHASLDKIYKWVDRLQPKMTYLTVLTHYMDYQALCKELPPHIRPCYDGQIIDI
jgi:phosphoribosyl 1,2-cyclic phosphate phosphodiesterase